MNLVDTVWNPVNTVTNGSKKNLAVLTGHRMKEGSFLQETVYGLFARRPKKVAVITIEVTVSPRWS